MIFGLQVDLRFEVLALSAISLASMPDASDFYGDRVPEIEEDPVVATAETKAGLRQLEFLHIAGAVG